MNNLTFFKNNVDFYSEEYRDYSLKPWEKKIVDSVSGRDVLDVACGGGRITVPLLRRGHNVVGVDFVGEFAPKIERHRAEFAGKFEFVEASMVNLPFPGNTFDTVVCVNSLVYLSSVRDVYRALSEMSRVLKLGGRLFITSWNLYHPLWLSSVILNYLFRRGRRFGETSPFWATDNRIVNSRTYMFVPTGKLLKDILRKSGVYCSVSTGGKFADSRRLDTFHPIIVITGVKEEG